MPTIEELQALEQQVSSALTQLQEIGSAVIGFEDDAGDSDDMARIQVELENVEGQLHRAASLSARLVEQMEEAEQGELDDEDAFDAE